MSSDVTTADDAQYQYKGVPLTPAIAQFLIRKLFAGKLVERQIIVDEVLSAHLAGGGLKASAQNLTGTIKKALGDMKETGAAENVSVGYWRIHEGPCVEGIESAASEVSLPATEALKVEPVASPNQLQTWSLALAEEQFTSTICRPIGCGLKNKARKLGHAKLDGLTVTHFHVCWPKLPQRCRSGHGLPSSFALPAPALGKRPFTAC
jgi:hypothetical protein